MACGLGTSRACALGGAYADGKASILGLYPPKDYANAVCWLRSAEACVEIHAYGRWPPSLARARAKSGPG